MTSTEDGNRDQQDARERNQSRRRTHGRTGELSPALLGRVAERVVRLREFPFSRCEHRFPALDGGDGFIRVVGEHDAWDSMSKRRIRPT